MATTQVSNRLNLRARLHAGNGWKGLGLLLLIAAVGGALLLVPALRKGPDTESGVNLPAMSNVPQSGRLHFEQQQP
jgi:hypothetical protein